MKNNYTEEELREIFTNNSDCYIDADDVEMGMSCERYIEVMRKLEILPPVEKPLDSIEWFKHPKEPFLNTAVIIELDNGKLCIAQLDDDNNRKCWLIQGSGKMYWRSMFEKIVRWRWMTPDEIVEYYVDRTLKLIENDKKSEI